jgi:hypothetical protein
VQRGFCLIRESALRTVASSTTLATADRSSSSFLSMLARFLRRHPGGKSAYLDGPPSSSGHRPVQNASQVLQSGCVTKSSSTPPYADLDPWHRHCRTRAGSSRTMARSSAGTRSGRLRFSATAPREQAVTFYRGTHCLGASSASQQESETDRPPCCLDRAVLETLQHTHASRWTITCVCHAGLAPPAFASGVTRFIC